MPMSNEQYSYLLPQLPYVIDIAIVIRIDDCNRAQTSLVLFALHIMFNVLY